MQYLFGLTHWLVVSAFIAFILLFHVLALMFSFQKKLSGKCWLEYQVREQSP